MIGINFIEKDTINKKNGKILHDEYGNFYIQLNDTIYFFNIDGKNNIQIEKLRNNIILKKIEELKKGKIKCLTSGNKLKAKIIDKTVSEFNEFDNFEDEDGNKDETYSSYQIYPEDKYYDKEDCQSIDSDESDHHDYSGFIDSVNFNFFGECDSINVDDFGYNSLYDTILLSGSHDSTNIIFKSEVKGDTSSYRLNIFTEGYVILNIVGSERKLFKLIYDNGDIKCEYVISRFAIDTGNNIKWI